MNVECSSTTILMQFRIVRDKLLIRTDIKCIFVVVFWNIFAFIMLEI